MFQSTFKQIGTASLLLFLIVGAVFAYFYYTTPLTITDYPPEKITSVAEPTIAKEDIPTHITLPRDRTLYENLDKRGEDKAKAQIKGAIIPHHLLAGQYIADLVHTLKKEPPAKILLISPDHFMRGRTPMSTTTYNWDTLYGELSTDQDFVEALENNFEEIQKNPELFDAEHGIHASLPLIAKHMPHTEIIPLTIKAGTSPELLDRLITYLYTNLSNDTVLIGSIDFSHYQDATATEFHDAYTRSIIRDFDTDRIFNTEIDSPETAYVILNLLEKYSATNITFEQYGNGSTFLKDPTLTYLTSYYSPYFTYGLPKTSYEKPVSMLFFGDMMLDRDVANKIKQFGPDYPFTKLAGEENRFFMGMDIVHTNLEGAVADVRRPTSKSIAFNFEKDLLQTLKKYNFDTVSLANNHSYDMGGAGFIETQKNLDEAGITHYGKQYEYSDDVSVTIKIIADQDIAFIGFNDTNRRLNLDETSDIVQKACSENDYCIVNVHWGYEYKQRSNPWQRELAHAYIDAGANAIIGHHPHVIQEMEIYKNKPIFYSLGNFIFDQYFSEETQQGLAVGMIFFQDELQLYLMPLESRAAQVSLMPYEQGKALLEKVVLPKDITLSEQGLYFNIQP